MTSNVAMACMLVIAASAAAGCASVTPQQARNFSDSELCTEYLTNSVENKPTDALEAEVIRRKLSCSSQMNSVVNEEAVRQEQSEERSAKIAAILDMVRAGLNANAANKAALQAAYERAQLDSINSAVSSTEQPFYAQPNSANANDAGSNAIVEQQNAAAAQEQSDMAKAAAEAAARREQLSQPESKPPLSIGSDGQIEQTRNQKSGQDVGPCHIDTKGGVVCH